MMILIILYGMDLKKVIVLNTEKEKDGVLLKDHLVAIDTVNKEDTQYFI